MLEGTNTAWRLIAPPENWRNPLPIEESSVAVLEEAGQRLGLRVTRDDERKKLYLGQPKLATPAGPVASGPSVTYPSGRTFAAVVPSEAEAAQYGVTEIYQEAKLIGPPADALLSSHFVAAEFFCHDPSYRFVRVSPALVRKLEELRTELGDRPLLINSAYRPPAYNAMIGGEPNSAHIDGLAADVTCPGVSTARLHEAALKVIGEAGGVGYYPSQGFVHVDVRGYAARWSE